MIRLSDQKTHAVLILVKRWHHPILIPSPLVSDGHLFFCPESKSLCLLPCPISQTINNMVGRDWADRHVYSIADCINEAFKLGSAGIT